MDRRTDYLIETQVVFIVLRRRLYLFSFMPKAECISHLSHQRISEKRGFRYARNLDTGNKKNLSPDLAGLQVLLLENVLAGTKVRVMSNERSYCFDISGVCWRQLSS